VIVQLETCPGGTAGSGVPTAHVPPGGMVKVPAPVGVESVIAVGTKGPASTLEPAGQGAATHRWRVLVSVMVPVIAAVLAGVVVKNGVLNAVVTVAIVSWPVSETY
jgi:hypothetical protein